MASAALKDGITSLFNSKRFSDLTIRCRGRRWYGHKSVLCTQSDFFAGVCENAPEESWDGVIDIQDDDADIVDAMLQFLYTGTYDDLADTENRLSAPEFNVRVLCLAEMYQVRELVPIAAEKYVSAARTSWASDGFASSIVEVYTDTGDSGNVLRDAILNIVMTHRTQLFKPGDEFQDFKTALVQVPGFAADTAQALANELEAPRVVGVYRCPDPDCKEVFVSKMRPGQTADWYCPKCELTCLHDFHEWQELRLHVARFLHGCDTKSRSEQQDSRTNGAEKD